MEHIEPFLNWVADHLPYVIFGAVGLGFLMWWLTAVQSVRRSTGLHPSARERDVGNIYKR